MPKAGSPTHATIAPSFGIIPVGSSLHTHGGGGGAAGGWGGRGGCGGGKGGTSAQTPPGPADGRVEQSVVPGESFQGVSGKPASQDS